jgi:hypothetical protein
MTIVECVLQLPDHRNRGRWLCRQGSGTAVEGDASRLGALNTIAARSALVPSAFGAAFEHADSA